jgi:type II secretory pathway pseudopilin PulG
LSLVKTALRFLKTNKKYPAYTLLELLVVLSIFIILGGMTFSGFDGLQNTVKMNEYLLTLEQDIRNVQRSSMLLQRDPGEKWIYGLGIDFSVMNEDGIYKVFKWCSPYNDYGDNITTKSNLPAYDPDIPLGDNGALPYDTLSLSNTCGNDVIEVSGALRTLPGYDKSIRLPKATILLDEARYVVFESVSGRAFLYNSMGLLLNYDENGDMLEEIVDFHITITPLGAGSTRELSIKPLSGKIETHVY